MWKTILKGAAGLVVLSIFGLTLAYLYQKSRKPPAVFETETPFVATIIRKTVATGAVVPRKEVALKPKVSGIVEKIHVEPGHVVRRGASVARIGIIPNQVTLSAAESRVARARLALDNARRDLERGEALFADGVIPERERRQYRLAHETAVEELRAARESLDLIRTGSAENADGASNTLVLATIDGTVLDVPVEEGDSVIEANTFNDGTTVATIADMDELIFEGTVDESEVGKIRVGMALILTVGAIEGERFGATLEHIAPKGVEQNGAIQFKIRAALEPVDSAALLRANLSANADIVLARRDDVLAIRESVLLFEGEDVYVEVETAPQRFERRRIETGLSDGIQIEVVSGLDPADRIKKPS